jgi:hypothetical protein
MRENIILRSCNPEEYPDLTISCRVIENDKIGEYVTQIPEERRSVSTKFAPVEARPGQEGEAITTTLYVERDGRRYILSEETTTVKVRPVGEQMLSDIVVRNINSTSDEEYVVKAAKFLDTYIPNEDGTYSPISEERQFYQVSEDVIIVTAWGSKAVCLNGSYIVEYNAEENDYNTVEQGAKNSTYQDVTVPKKVKQ